MKRKLLLTFILIVTLCFSFTITSFASSDYSEKLNNGMYIDINFNKQTHLKLPFNDFNSKYSLNFNDSDVYFLLYYDSQNGYYMIVCDDPIYISNIKDNLITIKTDTSYTLFQFRDNYWYRFMQSFTSTELTTEFHDVLMCSDNLSYNGEIIINKYTKSPLARTFQKIDTSNTVMKEILLLLPVVLVVIVGFIGIRKGIKFIKRKTQNA